MTAPARTLTAADFVLARLAEREMLARDMQQQASIGRPLVQLHGGGTLLRELVDPDSVLAQCEALRAVVVALSPHAHDSPAAHMAVDTAVRALASVWRDHPAFDPSWAAS
jgi:hypothetical protein